MLGLRTVRSGERVAVWDDGGRVRVVDGPARVGTWGKKVGPVSRVAAGAGEYLVIKFRDGRAEHVPGPASVWVDPVEHESVNVEAALALDGNEAVVVYRQGEDGAVARRVVRGPALFVPMAKEWLHEFHWHGADPHDPERKVPRGLHFTKLRVIPDQMYVSVADVRTRDDALLVIRLMIFFELMDVDVMLDQTHDVVGDFVNAASADVSDLVGPMTFDAFKQGTEKLNELTTYKQLAARAGRIGYRINKVVYRGYHASAKLQAMHDNAIEARTKLRLESETETQAQEIADLRLAREADRARQRQQMEADELGHKVRLKQVEQEQDLRRRGAEREAELRQRDAAAAQDLRIEEAAREAKLAGQRTADELTAARREARNRARLALLDAMRQMDVDLTRYLVSRYQHPDRHIRLDGVDGGRTRVHLNA